MLTKNQLIGSSLAIVFIILVLLFLIYKESYDDNIENIESKDKNEIKIKEDFPASAMNVLYSDASGNLSSTSDLGVNYLTATNGLSASTAIIDGNVSGNKVISKMGDKWGMMWGDSYAHIGKKGSPMRFGFADNTDASGWDEKMRLETDGSLSGMSSISTSGNVTVGGNLKVNGDSTTTSSKQKSATWWDGLECPDGKVMVGLEFYHPAHENWSYQEHFRLKCK